jgi:hypothetical protein
MSYGIQNSAEGRMTAQELQRAARVQGYTIRIEDRSLLDSTPMYAVYRGRERITRLFSPAAVGRWLAEQGRAG